MDKQLADKSLYVSRYTYLFISSTGKHLVYNSRSNSFMEINKELYHQLQSCQTENTAVENLKEQEKSMLCQRAIIVGPQGDDDFLLEHQYLTDKYSLSKQSLGLTIAPTLGCNFACPYCFVSIR